LEAANGDAYEAYAAFLRTLVGRQGVTGKACCMKEIYGG
jgi:hypothetical protein